MYRQRFGEARCLELNISPPAESLTLRRFGHVRTLITIIYPPNRGVTSLSSLYHTKYFVPTPEHQMRR